MFNKLLQNAARQYDLTPHTYPDCFDVLFQEKTAGYGGIRNPKEKKSPYVEFFDTHFFALLKSWVNSPSFYAIIL